MTAEHEVTELLAALRGYLEELQETGVDALPRGPVPARPDASPPLAPAPTERERLDEVRAGLGDCRRCELGQTRTGLVFGAGSPHARLVFVGEAPGEEEDRCGEPFAGEAGELLSKVIQAMGFTRDEVYICTIIKCRPPEDHDPQQEEIEACLPFLERQLRAIGPEVIVTLGPLASQTLLRTREPLTRLRGTFHDCHGIQLMPTFNPAYLLKHPDRKREVWADMQQVMRLLGKEVPKRDG
jgi:DNA polymerase